MNYTLEFWFVLMVTQVQLNILYWWRNNGSTGSNSIKINANGTLTMNEQVSNGDSYISTSTG